MLKRMLLELVPFEAVVLGKSPVVFGCRFVDGGFQYLIGINARKKLRWTAHVSIKILKIQTTQMN